MKYLIFQRGSLAMPVMFTGLQTHADVARQVTGADARARVVSAGFVAIRGRGADAGDEQSLGVSVYGESLSLNIASRPEDAEILRRELHRPD